MNQPADARLTPDVAQGRVRPDGQRRRPGRIDRGARQSVRPRPARDELHDRRHPRRRAGAGGTERRCPGRTQPDGDAVPHASRGIAAPPSRSIRCRSRTRRRRRWKPGRPTASASRVRFTIGAAASRAAVRACGRDRSGLCDGACAARAPLQHDRRVGVVAARACSRRTGCAIGPATSSGSSSTRSTTGTSPAIWNASSGRWRRGRRPIRAMPRLTACWPGSPRGAPANTRCTLDEADKAIALDADPDAAPTSAPRPTASSFLNRLADAEATVGRAPRAQASKRPRFS